MCQVHSTGSDLGEEVDGAGFALGRRKLPEDGHGQLNETHPVESMFLSELGNITKQLNLTSHVKEVVK